MKNEAKAMKRVKWIRRAHSRERIQEGILSKRRPNIISDGPEEAMSVPEERHSICSAFETKGASHARRCNPP